MKKLLGIVVLGLLWCTSSFGETIFVSGTRTLVKWWTSEAGNVFLVLLALWLIYDLIKALQYSNKKISPPNKGFGSGEVVNAYYFIEGLKKFAVFEGRASRKEFWHFYFMVIVYSIASVVIDAKIFDVSLDEGWGPAYFVTSLILIIPTLSIGARRLHDVGKSGWWQLVYLTGVGVILLIAWWASKSISGSYSKKIQTEKTSSKSKLAEELRELKELYNDGTLSKEEFTKAKNKLLK